MTPLQIIGIIQAGQILVSTGVVLATNIKALIATWTMSLSEAELNAIADLIIAGATAHKRLAELDTGKAT